jgi:hypothetical protein
MLQLLQNPTIEGRRTIARFAAIKTGLFEGGARRVCAEDYDDPRPRQSAATHVNAVINREAPAHLHECAVLLHWAYETDAESFGRPIETLLGLVTVHLTWHAGTWQHSGSIEALNLMSRGGLGSIRNPASSTGGSRGVSD